MQKFTQRLNDDGTETDEGPAGSIASIGEGTSVAAVTQPPTPVAPETLRPEMPRQRPLPLMALRRRTAAADPATGDSGCRTCAAAADPAAPATDPATAVAAATAPTTQPSESDSQVAVGPKKAIFYEGAPTSPKVRPSLAMSSGRWCRNRPATTSRRSRRSATKRRSPGKDVQLRMTIRRNADKTLPASHHRADLPDA